MERFQMIQPLLQRGARRFAGPSLDTLCLAHHHHSITTSTTTTAEPKPCATDTLDTLDGSGLKNHAQWTLHESTVGRLGEDAWLNVL